MLRRVALVITDISEECSAFFIRVTRIGELGTTLAVTNNWRTLRNISEDASLHFCVYLRRNLSEQNPILHEEFHYNNSQKY
jgi:hypothetical protein